MTRNGKTIEENRAETTDPGIIPGGIRERVLRAAMARSKNQAAEDFSPAANSLASVVPALT
jgi:hypothetical protein